MKTVQRAHPTAVVDREAVIGEDVEIGPYAVIGPHVVVGRGTRVMAHVVIEGPTRIGEGNVVHPFAVVGGAAQDKRHHDVGNGRGELVVGSRNVVREHVTIHRGTGGRATTIGDDNLFMASSHVAHDVVVGSHVVLANAVQLAGHAQVDDYATFGGLAGVAQRVRVGESAFVAAGAMCERDVPPFVVVQGDRACVRTLNRIGLERRGVERAAIERLEAAFRALFRPGVPRAQALAGLDAALLRDPLVAKLVAALGG